MLSTNISSIELLSPLYNASGVRCTTYNELLDLAENSHTGAVVTKTCTIDARDGNPLPRYSSEEGAKTSFSINSNGLANHGISCYADYTLRLKRVGCKKPLIISISVNDILYILKNLPNTLEPFDIIEINVSCPNINKEQLGYNFTELGLFLEEFFINNFPINKIIGLKLPPYFDQSHFDKVSEIINSYPQIKFVTCINSLGNGLIINDESTVIKPNNGFGGIGGIAVKAFALANVNAFYTRLKYAQVIGCGGVNTGRDVFEHILAGASAVQVGTTFQEEGIKCFERIEKELINIMEEKGYKCLEDFRGKLKRL